MEKVSLLKCDSYERDSLKRTISESLSNIHFDLKSFEGARVALKPNLMMPASPEKAVVTHPEFFRSIAEIVSENGGRPVLTECPGYMPLDRIIRKVGYAEVCRDVGIEAPDMNPIRVLRFDGAKIFKSLEISAAFDDVDIIINLPKLKTHGFMYISGAVKNLLGVIPGLKKSRMHMRCPENREFAGLLLDLYGALMNGFDKPKKIIHLVDAVVGQEGEGPGPAGIPRKIGAVLAGFDPVAVDWVAAGILGFDYKKVLTIPEGFQRNYLVSSPDEIMVVGERIEDLRIGDFVPTRASLPSHVLRGPLVGPTVKNLLMEKPVPSADKCNLCYNCKTICPAGAIEKANGLMKTPAYDYKKCIRCFCCMEVCPEAAISLKKGKLQWLLNMYGR